MTTRKDDLKLRPRTPAYVCRETGAAELDISPQTWDNWVAAQILPPAAPGFPESAPRWRWQDVDAKLNGKAAGDPDAFVSAAGRMRHGAPKESRRGLA